MRVCVCVDMVYYEIRTLALSTNEYLHFSSSCSFCTRAFKISKSMHILAFSCRKLSKTETENNYLKSFSCVNNLTCIIFGRK